MLLSLFSAPPTHTDADRLTRVTLSSVEERDGLVAKAIWCALPTSLLATAHQAFLIVARATAGGEVLSFAQRHTLQLRAVQFADAPMMSYNDVITYT